MEISKSYTDYAAKMIENLCGIPSPSGFTKEITRLVAQELQAMGYTVETTRKNAVITTLNEGGASLVLMAHLDTLGAMVRSIKSNGRLRLTKIGGYSEGTVEGENCLIHTRTGKQYSGTIQSVHPSVHVYDDVSSISREEKNIEVVLDEMVYSAKETENLGIQAGDVISFDPRTRITPSGYIKSRHLDDKAGSAVLLSFAKWVSDTKPELTRKIKLVFTSFEEVGHGGSSGFSAEDEEIISVDMGAIGDDLQGKETSVSICAKDSGGPYHYDLTSRLIECAKNEKIEYVVDIFPRYGSDVEASLIAGYKGVHGLIGPGVFASHGYERTHLNGIQNTIHLIIAYVLHP